MCSAYAYMTLGLSLSIQGFFYVNLGLFFFLPIRFTGVPTFTRTAVHKRLEDVCLELDGFVALYADTFFGREKFDKMYYKYSKLYEMVRKQMPLTEKAFPHVYEKISSIGRKNLVKDEEKSEK